MSEVEVQFEPITGERAEAIQTAFPNYTDGLVRGNPGGFCITPGFAKRAREIKNFPLDPKDVWIVTFAKAGTTWTQEAIWLLSNNLDYEGSKRDLNLRMPFIDMTSLPPESMVQEARAYAEKNGTGGDLELNLEPSVIAAMPSPRYIKSHVPFYLLNSKLLDTCKVVYVARNPKDIAVSYFYHHKLIKFHQVDTDFAGFADFFMRDEIIYSPYWPHVLEAWNLRDHPNMLFIFYEDMKEDLLREIKKIAAHLGKDYSEEQMVALRDHLKFDNIKKNPAVNKEGGKESGFMSKSGNFIRKGKAGDWESHFTPELNKKFDEWIAESTKNSDIQFRYKLEKQE